ncbi:MAG: hypothetical protein PHD29_00755 [bacterium]|nr:hypothetical protein [bacterium]MDD5354383.1 hypothetical protein [bacterium]MDD5756771.1 hypothetical protein [bacterium]
MAGDEKPKIEDQTVNTPETEEGWDPANVAATIVIVIVCIGLLFWLFWSLMVAHSLTTNIIAAVVLLIVTGEVIYIFKK